jgi:hypothetical protein
VKRSATSRTITRETIKRITTLSPSPTNSTMTTTRFYSLILSLIPTLTLLSISVRSSLRISNGLKEILSVEL